MEVVSASFGVMVMQFGVVEAQQAGTEISKVMLEAEIFVALQIVKVDTFVAIVRVWCC